MKNIDNILELRGIVRNKSSENLYKLHSNNITNQINIITPIQ